MDTIAIEFYVTCAIALIGIITAAVCCNRLEKRIKSWQDNLKDIEK